MPRDRYQASLAQLEFCPVLQQFVHFLNLVSALEMIPPLRLKTFLAIAWIGVASGIDTTKLVFTLANRVENFSRDVPFSPEDNGSSLFAAGFSADTSNDGRVCITIHGFEGSSKDGFNQHITMGLLANEENPSQCSYLIRCDYSFYSHDFYVTLALTEVPVIGKAIGQILLPYLEENGVPLENLRIFGFSLGCIVAGQVGAAQNGRVGIIDCMDHAGFLIPPPPFYPYYLKCKHALQVRSILCSNTLGTTFATGCVNYVINTGKQQPQCDQFKGSSQVYATCNHLQCYRFFATILADPKAYPASSCPSAFAAENTPENCQSNSSVLVGETPDNDSAGVFSARITGCRFPFSCPTDENF